MLIKVIVAIRYSSVIDYTSLDRLKRYAVDIFEETLTFPEKSIGIKAVPVKNGTSWVVFDFSKFDSSQFYHTPSITEHLGTKSLIADNIYLDILNKKVIADSFDTNKIYRGLGQDTAAMAINDVLSLGAYPYSYSDIIATGRATWFNDEKGQLSERSKELLNGYKIAAEIGKFAIPQGETPALPDVINPESLDLGGAAQGLIYPRKRLMTGNNIRVMDSIYMIQSSGIHANGISKARNLAKKLKEGMFTQLSNGKTLGEELLTPTFIYTQPVMDLFENEIDIHYLQLISGHGWQKVARAVSPFDYIITSLPPVPLVLKELISLGKEYNKKNTPKNRFDFSDQENYNTWNMGAGYMVIAPQDNFEHIKEIVKHHDMDVYSVGFVDKGNRNVIMPFKEDNKHVVYTY